MKRLSIAALAKNAAACCGITSAALLLVTASAQRAPMPPVTPPAGTGAPSPTMPGGPGSSGGAPATSGTSQGQGTPGNTNPPIVGRPDAPSSGTNQPAAGDSAAAPRKQTQKPPLPTNPLLLGQSQRAEDPTLLTHIPGFIDYRQPVAVGRPHGYRDALPIFGYDFFQPARELVLAHRAYLRRQYQGPSTRSGSAQPAANANGVNGAQQGRQNQQGQPNQPGQSNQSPQDGFGNTGGEGAGSRPNDPSMPMPGGTVTLPDGRQVTLPALPGDYRKPATDPANGYPAGQPAAPDYNAPGAAFRPDPNSGDPTNQAYGQSAGYSGVDSAGNFGGRPGAVNGFDEVADPLSQLYRNVAASVPPNYQLSGGDTLNIRYWSPRHETRTLSCVVDSGGALTVDEIGLIVVRGMTLEQSEKMLRERLRRFYNGVEVSVTLAKLRTIQVTLTGAAFQPGTFTVPAVASAYNVLYAAGGPLEDGSLRGIEVRRNGKIAGTLDLYNFLLVGNKGGDIQLQSGDLIYIPHRKSRVQVTGEVLQPAMFELREGETLKDLLQFAGGIRASAVAQRVRINTVDPGNARVQKDVDISKPEGGRQPVFDGDEVEVFSVRPLITNTVTIDGAVDQPSAYALVPNMRVSDLVERARGVISEAYLTRANLYRWNANNTTTLISIDLQKALAHDHAADIALERWDRLTVFSRSEVAWTGQRTITVRGAVQRAGAYTLSDNMRISDLLLLAGGPSPDAYLDRAVLLHQHGDGTYGLDYVDIAGMPGKDAAKDVVLHDRDILAVYKTGEAQFEPEHVATIHGEVVTPGPFPRADGMHLSDLIKLAGGFKPGANPSVSIAHARRAVAGPNATINVVQIRFDENHRCAAQDDVAIEDGDVITVQGTGGFIDAVQVINVKGAVNRPGPVIMTGKTMRLTDALAAAGGLRPEAFPFGAEFYRDPKMMATDSQRSLAAVIGSLNDLLNDSTYSRERGKSYVERIRSINAASQPEQSPLAPQAAQQPAALSAPLAMGLAQQEMVSPARKLTDDQMNPNGNIAVNLAEALRHPKGSEDILLVDGDTITVPEAPTTVQVVGAVFHGRGVLYKPGAKLDYYIAQTGGFAPDAARDRVELIHIGGGLVPAAKNAVPLAGDVILVPTRVLAEKIASHQDGLGSLFKSLTSSAILFKVATSLFGL